MKISFKHFFLQLRKTDVFNFDFIRCTYEFLISPHIYHDANQSECLEIMQPTIEIPINIWYPIHFFQIGIFFEKAQKVRLLMS